MGALTAALISACSPSSDGVALCDSDGDRVIVAAPRLTIVCVHPEK